MQLEKALWIRGMIIQEYLHTLRETYTLEFNMLNTKMKVWKMMFLFNWVICRFHVNFPGCTGIPIPSPVFFEEDVPFHLRLGIYSCSLYGNELAQWSPTSTKLVKSRLPQRYTSIQQCTSCGRVRLWGGCCLLWWDVWEFEERGVAWDCIFCQIQSRTINNTKATKTWIAKKRSNALQ